MTTVAFTDFRKQASGMLSRVEQGEVFVIMRHGRPVAELTPVPASREHRQPAWKRPGLRLAAPGAALSRAILEDREHA